MNAPGEAAQATESSDQPHARSRITSGLKSLAQGLAATVVLVAVLEVTLRVGTYFWHGQSEYYLYYGMHNLAGRVGISPWSVFDGSHYKFPPRYVLKGAAGQRRGETASTNSLGFRGPDFEPEKPGNAFRIVALGGSSTFGFHNSDTGTYPYLLQELLEADSAVSRLDVEVINAGFPYYNTGSIRSLLEAELLDYDPDLLTLYSAYNDASWPLQVGAAAQAIMWVQQHSITYLLLKESVLTDQRVYRLQKMLHDRFPKEADLELIEAHAERVAARYRANVEAITEIAAERGIAVCLIRQPVTTRVQNREYADYPYEKEYEAIVEKLARGAFVSVFDTRMILHRRLIDELDRIAEERNLPVVDNIAIVDEDRSRLTTWVHLTEEANARLAEAIRDAAEPFVQEAARRGRAAGHGQAAGEIEEKASRLGT